MIKLEQLYSETRQGLDIILYYYPQAQPCVEEPKRKFKAREGEKTASAVLLPPDQKHAYYRVCDFGDEGHGLSPIDVAMKQEGATQNRFYETVLRLAQRHNVRDELNEQVNKPRMDACEATPQEKEGDRPFRLLPKIPEEHLKIFGPRVTQEHCDTLHWHEAEYIGYVHNGRVSLRYSTEFYPIFMRECLTDDGRTFYKIYEPLNPDKARRFSYTPQGVKPKQYINGWRELLHALDLANALREPEEPEVKTLPEAFICSGERDAICCLSMGGQPLWFNSETYTLQPAEYAMLQERVDTLYNIPDIDATGRRKGSELALRYMDLRTLWLPDWLLTFRDNRGRPRKDLRDWMELRQQKADFTALRDTAIQARFWDRTTRDKKTDYTISSIRLYYFLHLNGFRTLRDDDSDFCRYIRIEGNVVSPVRARDVRRFVREWAEERLLGEQVRNLIVNSMKFSETSLENLREVNLDFTSSTPRSQTFFFTNTVVEVSDTGLREFRSQDAPCACYVWADSVIPHRVTLLPPQFTVERTPDGFRLHILDATRSPFLGYLINASRLHWRKEMETRFLADGDTPEARERIRDYAFFHRFTIDGDGLTEAEIAEQRLCLLNKLFAIGYLLHRYKTPSRPWAAVALDNKIGDLGECNGRSGKSFLFRTLAMFLGTVTLSGRNPRLMDNPHVFDQVSRHTDLILVDDCAMALPLNLFFDLITSDMTVNPKNNRSFTIPFALSPKFAFSTNYVPLSVDASSDARSLYIIFSDYYHERTPAANDYRQSRRIADDFGLDLYGDQYTPEQWNADINVLLLCEAFYLSLYDTNIKITPPMDNILRRIRLQQMGDNFQEWAASYFAPGAGHLNRALVRREVFEHFRLYANTQKATMQSFTKKLRAFCDVTPYIRALNPQRLVNRQGRILQWVGDKKEEMIYIEADDDDEATPADADPPF